jgi:hypothetical protein
MNQVQRLRIAVAGLLVAVVLLSAFHAGERWRVAALEKQVRSLQQERQQAQDQWEAKELDWEGKWIRRDLQDAHHWHLYRSSYANALSLEARVAEYERLHPALGLRYVPRGVTLATIDAELRPRWDATAWRDVGPIEDPVIDKAPKDPKRK